MEDVCHTREAALERAIETEAASYKVYRDAYLRAKDPLAKDLLRDLALDELRHKYILEKAFFEETVLLHDTGVNSGPSLKFSLLSEGKPLNPDATVQEVMIHAIHEEKRAVDFYKNMAEQCGGAPTSEMFKRLAQDEEGHLARLEDLYEKAYRKEMEPERGRLS